MPYHTRGVLLSCRGRYLRRRSSKKLSKSPRGVLLSRGCYLRRRSNENFSNPIRSFDTDSWQCCVRISYTTVAIDYERERTGNDAPRIDFVVRAPFVYVFHKRFTHSYGPSETRLHVCTYRSCRSARRAHRTSYSTQPAGRAIGDARSYARSLTGAGGETRSETNDTIIRGTCNREARTRSLPPAWALAKSPLAACCFRAAVVTSGAARVKSFLSPLATCCFRAVVTSGAARAKS